MLRISHDHFVHTWDIELFISLDLLVLHFHFYICTFKIIVFMKYNCTIPVHFLGILWTFCSWFCLAYPAQGGGTSLRPCCCFCSLLHILRYCLASEFDGGWAMKDCLGKGGPQVRFSAKSANSPIQLNHPQETLTKCVSCFKGWCLI